MQNRDVTCSSDRLCAPRQTPARQSTRRTTQRTTQRTKQRTTSKGSSSKSSSASNGGVTDAELKAFTEELIKIDDDNVAGLVSFDAGCSTKVGRPTDCSPDSLITRVEDSVLKRPIYRKLQALYENYNNDVTVVEDRTSSERAEEDQLLEEIMKSKVMIKTLEFLKSQNVFTKSANDFKKLLKELWFDVYSRGQSTIFFSLFFDHFISRKKDSGFQWLRARLSGREEKRSSSRFKIVFRCLI